MPLPRPVFVVANEDSGPAWMSIKADAATTGGVLGLAEATIPFGHSPGLHVHRDEDEAFYVLQGTVDSL